ncbi:NUDIX domain-containing protein [Simiduia agarivorans]|uniref:Beta-lactamase-like protein n=1 Tax=Simiduia agarivorans (strain DSM 21679 / JCM 13881 / BCRC 17597 / SA1) TaxID=1117647 RepID=K4KG63_SIMAS|nr:NUDIX hydrolase [Simiduia agarivorans]AFU97961.1 beta-lactamase-like protein [Simiduia agarivorans SA1 = DSM 21679]
MTEISEQKTPLQASAAIVLVQDSAQGLQVLLGRRSLTTPVASGMWVFPGGGLTSAERSLGETGYRLAAIRELAEEVPDNPWKGDANDLLALGQWHTPEFLSKRFDTRFYLAVAGYGPLKADGYELINVIWSQPALALRDCISSMMFPTAAILAWLAAYHDVAGVLYALAEGPLPVVCPRLTEESGEQWLEIDAPQYPLRRWRVSR